MSTSQALPVQVNLPAKSGNNVVSSKAEPSDASPKGDFGGVLNDELDAVTETDAVTTVEATDAKPNEGLPVDGNDLPFVINSQLQADIAELDIEDIEISVTLEQASVAGLNLASIELISKDAVAISSSKDSLLGQKTAISNQADTIRFITNTPLQPVKTEAANQTISLLPFISGGIDSETQAVTQFKESLQLQKIFSPLARQAEVGIEAVQIGRVFEQFTDLNQKPIISPTIQTVVNSTPLSETSAATTTQLSVDVPVQDQRWQKAFSQRVVWSVGNVQSAQLRLNPAELGRIDIQVNIEKDKANVVFTTQQGVVKEAIEQALPRLREMLAEEGVDLENVDIFHDDFNQQQAGNNNSSSQQELENRIWNNSQEEEQLDENTMVSQITFNDDSVDYYV